MCYILSLQFKEYRGMFKNGFKHGRGVQTVPTGYKYHGDWVKGFIDGSGTLFMPGGETVVRLWSKLTLKEAIELILKEKKETLQQEVNRR